MFTDVLIIGAGPCGLAVASRLAESTPSALFTDDEHLRFWKRFNRKDSLQAEAAKRRKLSSQSRSSSDSGYESDSRVTHPPKNNTTPSIIVLDATSDSWLGGWKSRFSRLQISHLRSPLFFHPDPRDRDGLLAYAYEQGRESELTEIQNVAGKEFTKHERKKQQRRTKKQPKIEPHMRVDGRDRIDYFTPSSRLFEDYCQSVVERYGLHNSVQRATVESIVYDDVGCPSGGRVFKVDTDRGLYLARIVVVATGPTAKPCLPMDHNLRLPSDSPEAMAAVSHVFSPTGLSLPPHVRGKIASGATINVVVVGGGLTSAQVATVLISQGVSHVHLLMRDRYKLKHFDVDLEWVSKVRNHRMSEFWSADTDRERAEMLRAAKNGGSIPPAYDRGLKALVRRGKLTICPRTTIASGDYGQAGWALQTDPPIPNLPDKIDHVFFATGVMPDFNRIPFLAKLRDEWPLDTIMGLPVITHDLTYNQDVPLFFTGALAGLRLGPGAANLAGARQGAERIAWKIDDVLSLEPPTRSCTNVSLPCEDPQQDSRLGLDGRCEVAEKEADEDTEQPKLSRASWNAFTGGWANRFQSLSLLPDDADVVQNA